MEETMIDRLWQEAKRRFEEQMGPVEKYLEAWKKYNIYLMTGEKK